MSIDEFKTPPSVTAGESQPPTTGLPRLALGVATLLCCLYLGSEVFVFSRLAFPLDDSWIHLQFARQMADGHGLTYNGDQWIPGSTAPLWTALLAVGILLPVNAMVWAKLLGILAFLAAVIASDRLAVELGLRRTLRTVATLSVAGCHWLVWSALSGMEICLFLAVSLWGLVFHLRSRHGGPASSQGIDLRGPFLFAVASLLRPEGMLLLVLAFCDRAVTWHRTTAVDGDCLRLRWAMASKDLVHGLIVTGLLLLPSFGFHLISSGSPFATTLAVKGGGGGWLPDGGHLRQVLTILWTSQPTLVLVAGAGCLVLVRRLGGVEDRGLLPGLWLLGLPLANAIISPRALGNFGRYYFPLLPLVAILGALGLSYVWDHLGRWLYLGDAGRRRIPLRALLVIALLMPQLWGVMQGPPRYLQTLSNVEDSDVKAARWLAPRLPPEALLAVQDIGALKFWLPNSVVDLAGIVTPEIQSILAQGRGEGPTYWERRLYDELARRRPDYLVVFPTSYPMLTQPGSGFQEVQRFAVENNVTMAGSQLVIYQTPWTRHPLRQIAEP